MKTFKLEIELENDDVADLDTIAIRVGTLTSYAFLECEKGKIKDLNGNTIGHWELEDDDEQS